MGQNTQRPPTRAPLPPGVLEDSRLSTESRLLLVLLNTRQTAGVVDLHIEQLAVDMGKSASSVSRYLRELRAWRLVSEAYLEPGRGRRVRLMGGSGGWMQATPRHAGEFETGEATARALGARPHLDDVEAQEKLEFDDVAPELDPNGTTLIERWGENRVALRFGDGSGGFFLDRAGEINGRPVFMLEGMGK